VADGEAEARAVTDRLRREERIEHAPEELRPDASAGVDDLDDDASLAIDLGPDAERLRRGIALGHRLGGVAQEIDKDLLQARAIGRDARHGAVFFDHRRASRELAAQQEER
jgi:hypothetical protein